MRRKPSDHRALLASTIIHLRSRKAVSRSALAKALNASASTLGLYVDQLTAMGYIEEVGLEKANVGRPQRVLGLISNAGWFAGLEFNAQRVQAVSVDFSGKVLGIENRTLPAKPEMPTVLRALVDALEKLAGARSEPLLGIGIGAPGIVDRKRGIARYFSFVKDWKNVPIADVFRQRFRVPTTLENNLRVIALAERWFGEGRDLNDYVVLGPRSGFGMSIMHDGELMRGAHEIAGEVGLWTWPQPDGTQAMHDLLSATAVYRRLAGLGPDAALPEDLRPAISQIAKPGSPEWKSVVLDFARVVRSIQLLVDPEKIFLHGPLTSLGMPFCDEISHLVTTLPPQLPDMKIKLEPSKLGDDAGALGAASLAMEEWEPQV
jgi:predicted NBD/HSP70 family sugar kinase